MPRVRRSVRQKVIVAAAVAALLAGAALAAVSATGQDNPRRVSSAQRAARHRAHTGALAPAAAYLGVTVQQLSEQLRSGKTLAQIANSTNGKSEAGLVAALLAAKQAKLAHAAATLPRRVSAEVNRAGGPRTAAGSRRAAEGHAPAARHLVRRSELARDGRLALPGPVGDQLEDTAARRQDARPARRRHARQVERGPRRCARGRAPAADGAHRRLRQAVEREARQASGAAAEAREPARPAQLRGRLSS